MQPDSFGWIWTSGLTSTAFLQYVHCVVSGNRLRFKKISFPLFAWNTSVCMCRQILKGNQHLLENTHQLICLQLTMHILVVAVKQHDFPTSSRLRGVQEVLWFKELISCLTTVHTPRRTNMCKCTAERNCHRMNIFSDTQYLIHSLIT